jgi:hypothetical protein
MIPHGSRFVDSLRHMVLQFRQKTLVEPDDETSVTTTTPSPTTSFSETSTTTIHSKRHPSTATIDTQPGPSGLNDYNKPTTSAPTSRRKSGLLLSRVMKTGSIDIITSMISPSLGTGPPSAPAIVTGSLSRESSEKRKKCMKKRVWCI